MYLCVQLEVQIAATNYQIPPATNSRKKTNFSQAYSYDPISPGC